MRILAAILFFVCSAANAQFVTGQILTSSQLNAAFANVLSTSGGTLTGPLTVPALNVTGTTSFSNVAVTGGTITGLSAPIPLASGGTGAVTQSAALAAVLGSSAVPIANGGTNATTATGATSQLQYLQGASGSVARTLTKKFQDVINVNDFGADPTGVADSTTAITNAEAACPTNGCEIVFGTGTYIVSTVTINKQGLWRGAGASTGGTQILTNSATANVFDITNSSVYIRDMLFNSSVTRTAGAYILCDTTSSIVSVEDVFMLNWYIGIRVTAAGGPFYFRNVTLKNGVPTTGQGVRIENGTGVALDYVIIDNPPASKPQSCVTITQSADVSFINSQLQHCGIGLALTPGANQVVTSVYSVNTFFDNSGTDGVLIQPLSGTASAVTRVRFTGCWASSSGGGGIHIDNSTTGGAGGIDGIEIIGLESLANTNGVAINVTGAGNGHIDILGGKFAGNSNDAVQVFNVTSGLKIVGARIGPTGALGGNGLGIQIANGTISNLVVSDNDLTGNSGAGYTNASSGTSRIIKGNLGFNPIASTAITVTASPFTYTNNTGDTVNVFVTGGTVSSVTLGGNTVAAATNTVVPVPQGASAVVTYTATPTMTYVGY